MVGRPLSLSPTTYKLRYILLVGLTLLRLSYSNVETSMSASATLPSSINNDQAIKVVFSDVDGTLVHYPTHVGDTLDDNDTIDIDEYEKLYLPPSSTGMRGVISRRTLDLCQHLRKEHGVKLVLVSGMRSTTLLQRLPFLPLADAYCSEGGGRIFYPTGEYSSDGRLQLREDLSWRRKLEDTNAAGPDGFTNPLNEKTKEIIVSNENDVLSTTSISDRQGKLWDFARQLLREGWTIDYKGYATSFRIKFERDSPESIDQLLKIIPHELSTSVNLGMADVYPRESGKVNACKYLCTIFGGHNLAESSYCMCDDDNDIEMARACKHAFLPSLTSESMVESVGKDPDHFTVTCNDNRGGTKATDAAIQAIIDSIYNCVN